MRSLPLLVAYKADKAIVRALCKDLHLPSSEVQLAQDLFSQGLPPLTRRAWIPLLFGVSSKLVGAMERRSERYYRTFKIRKRTGSDRQISTPRRFLKTIQRWILHQILPHLKVSEHAHGFVKGKNIFTNAANHLTGANLLALDISDFFDAIAEVRVSNLLKSSLPFPEEVAIQLAGLCTLSGSLPQGAPTSPALANAVFFEADQDISNLATEWSCSYSRYADDLAISGSRRFDHVDLAQVSQQISKHGFSVNTDKTRIIGAGSRQIVTGLVVNEKGLPPRSTRRRWRATFHQADLYPQNFVSELDRLFGIAAFVAQYDRHLSNQYQEVARKVRIQAAKS